MPDVAYAIEGVPQPKRQYGRTWADVARDEFLSYITLGVPPWAREAWRPEHRLRIPVKLNADSAQRERGFRRR